jgi:hypothetical protein
LLDVAAHPSPALAPGSRTSRLRAEVRGENPLTLGTLDQTGNAASGANAGLKLRDMGFAQHAQRQRQQQ